MTGRHRMRLIGLGGLLMAGVSGCGPGVPSGSPAIVVRSSTGTTSPPSQSRQQHPRPFPRPQR